MSIIAKRQHGHTWNNVPTIDGSRWGFIGLMIGIFFLVLTFLIILISCLCRRRSTNRKMDYAATGSNLATTHPEPTYPRIKPTPAPQMVEAEEGNASLHHHNAAYPTESYNNNYHNNNGYEYQGVGRDDMQQYGHGNQGYAESQHYQGSNYDQHTDEPQFDPVAAPIGGAYHPNPYQASSSSHSMHRNQAGYPNQQASTYPQTGYTQAAGYPQPTHSPAPTNQSAHPQFQQHMESYPEPQAHEQYGQAYSSGPTGEETPPAYPAGSVEHTHDLPKSRMPPPGGM